MIGNLAARGKKKVKLISTQKCQQFISVTFLQINPVLGILSLISKPRCGWDSGSPLGLQGGGAVAGSCTEELGWLRGPMRVLWGLQRTLKSHFSGEQGLACPSTGMAP